MRDSDAEAAAAWDDRMQAVRHGCASAVRALAADNILRTDLSEERATDILWTLLSVENWEQLVRDCGWSQLDYKGLMRRLAEAGLIEQH